MRSCESRVNSRPLKSAAGFSLVELLITVVVIAIISSLVVVSFGGNSYKRQLKAEAERLGLVLGLAADESVYLGKEIGVQFFEDGYRFVVWEDNADSLGSEQSSNAASEQADGDPYQAQVQGAQPEAAQGYTGSWKLMSGDKAFAAHKFENAFRFYVEIEDGEEVQLLSSNDWDEIKTDSVVATNESGVAAELSYDPSKEKYPPAILLLSSGEMTPFSIELHAEEDLEFIFKITGNMVGKVSVIRPGQGYE